MRKLACSLMLLLCVAAARGQKPAPASAPKPLAGRTIGAFFALSVADVEATSAWYRDKLGFRIASHGEAPNKIAKFAILEGEGSIIEMIQHRDAKPRAVAAPGVKEDHLIHGIFKVGFHVADLDAVYRRVKERGIPIAYDLMQAKDIGLRSFSIRDREDNLIQFFGP
jgi:catechol 2,3-dioxygenase-like lactoylglutathione lyase family enzyme